MAYPMDQQALRPVLGHNDDVLYALRKACDQRLRQMEAMRWSWWQHWRLLARYIQPRLGRFLATAMYTAGRGHPKNQSIINSTGSTAANRFAAGMMAGASSPARPWFKLVAGREDLAEDPDVKAWLDTVQKVMNRVFAKSNFYRSLATVYENLGVFGSAAMLIYEDFEDVIRCYVPAMGEFYLANDGRLDCTTLYRKFTMTIGEITTRWPAGRYSETIKSAIVNNKLENEIIVGHAIELNDKRVAGVPGHKGMAYRELYWEFGQGESTWLDVKGYHEKPFCGGRWNVTSNDAYGRAPGMDALGDIIQIQIQEREKAKAIQKVNNPPLVADSRLKNEPATSIPGGVTYVPNGAASEGFKSLYQIEPDIAAIIQDIERTEGRVKAVFFEDLFLAISQLDTVRTATEVVERKEEKMLMLGPPLERTHNEVLDVAIDRVYGICTRARLFPPPPPAMHGDFIGVEYVSPLAQAQKAVATTAMERLAGFVGNLAAGQEGAGKVPEVLDKVDFDEMVDEYADAIGAPPKLIVSQRKVAQIRAQRAQQQQQQAQAEQMAQASQTAKNLGQTPTTGGNAASDVMGLFSQGLASTPGQ